MSNDLSFLKVTIGDDEERLLYKNPHQSMIPKKTIASITFLESDGKEHREFNADIIVDFGRGESLRYRYKYLHDAKELYKLLCDALASDEKVSEVVFLGEHERITEK